MENSERKRKVLVIGSIPEFRELIRDSLQDQFEVAYASSESEGLAKARAERPETLILGYLDPRGSSFRLHKMLREGWITR
jgi:PleD family two-component response regulator